tara:strand:- start:6677 stop:7366 length:690 start_codon:yes stop_codon:yes gene_type:complete
MPLPALSSQIATAFSPVRAATPSASPEVTGYIAKNVAKSIKGQDGQSLDPYTTGIIAGISQSGFTGQDPLYSVTENIERLGGPGLGFGATGPGTRKTFERYVPGGAEASRTLGPLIQPMAEGNAGTLAAPQGVDWKPQLTYDPGMLFEGGAFNVRADPAMVPAAGPPPTPVFGSTLRPPEIDYSYVPPMPPTPTRAPAPDPLTGYPLNEMGEPLNPDTGLPVDPNAIRR